MVRKHFGLPTWVPPHPPDDRSVWSCLPEFGKRVARSGRATLRSAPHHGVRDRVVDAHRADGWRTVAERAGEIGDAGAAAVPGSGGGARDVPGRSG